MLLARMALSQPALEPVDYPRLTPFLPERVVGFVAEPATGSSSSGMGFQISEVARTYRKATASAATPTIRLRIADGAGNPFFLAAYAPVDPFYKERGDGYDRAFTLDGYPATETYDRPHQRGRLSVLVGGHYVVEIAIVNLPSDTLQEWWKKIDAKKLAAVKLD
jgi:hypothetical protein